MTEVPTFQELTAAVSAASKAGAAVVLDPSGRSFRTEQPELPFDAEEDGE